MSFSCQRITAWVPTAISIALLVLRKNAALRLQHPTPLSRNHRVAQEILEGLQSSSRNRKAAIEIDADDDDDGNNARTAAAAAPSPHLDLETDFYDPATGLHSEGVWHNCMAGIAALRLSRSAHLPRKERRRRFDDAARIADSLFRHAWDGTSFRRRAWSGSWDHSRLRLGDKEVVQSNYYGESSERRCIQHAIALVFWSMLAQDRRGDSEGARSNGVLSQQSQIAKQFVDEYWNGKRWTTIGKSQGSGTTLRPSASGGVSRADAGAEGGPYFRAADQALAVVACLHHVRLLDDGAKDGDGDGDGDGVDDGAERKMFEDIVGATCRDLLDDADGFGYDDPSRARTYLGMDRNRNFWHDGWTILALTLAARDRVGPIDAREGRPRALWDELVEGYADAPGGRGVEDDAGATVWHWPLSTKGIESNVRYCGDNALAYAIRRNLKSCQSAVGEVGEEEDGDVDDEAFWSFVDMLRSENKKGRDVNEECHLASVADVYPQVRLHPNTELAALLVWPP